MTEEKTLESGAKLKITLASFAEGKALYQACLEECQTLKIDGASEIDFNLLKDLFCLGLSSKKIEAALKPCLQRALYNDRRITDDVFEEAEARADYLDVLLEVAQVNLLPFTRNLRRRYGALLSRLQSEALVSTSTTKTS